MADVLSVVIRIMEAMSRAFMLKVRAEALWSILSTFNMHISELESQHASKILKLDAAVANLESTDWHFRFAEDAVPLMQKQVQNQGPLICEVQAVMLLQRRP